MIHAFGLCDRHHSGEIRVFGVIFEVPSVQRIAVNIDAGSEQCIDVVAVQLHTFKSEKLFYKRKIEGARKQRTIRKAESGRAAVHTDSGRTVRAAAGRDAEVLQALCDAAKCSSGSRSDLWTAHAFAVYDMLQVLICKLCKKMGIVCVSILYIGKPYAGIAGIRQTIRKGCCALVHRIDRACRGRDVRDPVRMVGSETGRSSIRQCGNRLHTRKFLYRSHAFCQCFGYKRFGNEKASGRCRASHIASGIQCISTGFKHETGLVTGGSAVIIGGKCGLWYGKLERFCAPGLQCPGLCKGTEHAGWFSEQPLWRFGIDLNDFFSGSGTDICDDGGDRQMIRSFGHRILCRKGRVGQSKPERIAHPVFCKSLKITVADVDILGVEVLLSRTEILAGRIIRVIKGDGIRQPSGRRETAKDVSSAAAALHAALPYIENGRRLIVVNPAHIHDISDIQYDGSAGEGGAYHFQHFPFCLCQIVAALLRGVVTVFAGGTSEDDQRQIRMCRGICHKCIRKRHFLLTPRFGSPAVSAIERVLLCPALVFGQHRLIDLNFLMLP